MLTVANLQPNIVLGDNILSLAPELLIQHDIRGLILDVDETLVPFKRREVSQELKKWIEEIRQVADIWLVSNNLSRNRIGNIAKELNVPYLAAARKPSRRKLKIAAQAMNLPPKQIAMVGDRLFTDVLAGNRLGMFTILVEPMLEAGKSNKGFYPIRDFEVWLSQMLGVSLGSAQKKFTKY
ncbi:MAG: YqeG family HAD IIIA-type phosphatase [Cyanobacteria bacterium J083]|nr:MAG: YqeG family HAD IIIA-type phosphatase [Cyanobacteria bacterium J083]